MTWDEFVAECIPQPRTIRVEAYEGSGAYGDVYGSPVDVGPCVVDDTNRVVAVQTQDAEGTEAVSSTTVFCPPDANVPPGSRITLPGGRTARVLATSRLDAHGLPLPEHVELSLE
ncbi:hypothetical protein [Actinoplanes aureus]|uniref:Head-to-tail stopper n=1 Tax=Actinoplanes aureus TaxID=2792083 RepID=A0A931C001_9ACTN|nr:hypothetical protein [Actinoplanes aureus]MBG0560724.1 hypothetical protein [Actinoplanes aureus]